MTYQFYGRDNKTQVRYNEIKNKIILELRKHIGLNEDVLEIIFDYIVITRKYKLLTNNDCIIASKFRLINKNLSSVFQIYNLRIIDINFNDFSHYIYYNELVNNTKKLEIISNGYIDIKNLIVNEHKPKIIEIIKEYERRACTKTIDHSDYIYLCNFYGYEYKNYDHPYARITYTSCSLCYLFTCGLFCPIYCLFCPCLVCWQIQSCNHDPDPEEKHGPIALFELPLDICNPINRDKTTCQILNRYYCC